MNPEPTPSSGDIASVLDQALSDILEKSAFMFSEKADGPKPDFGEAPCACVSIRFDGPVHGILHMTAPANFGVQVAANTLGEDPATIPTEQAADAMKELLNVICGRLLELYSGARAIFNLSIPTLTTMTPAEVLVLSRSPGSAVFIVDESPVLLHVEMTP
jgi:hypothetical protein